MRGMNRIDLISRIGRELQERMTFSDIDVYLHGFKINTNIPNISTNSKWVYAKEILGNVGDDIILKIADELEIDHNFKSISTNPQIECKFWTEGYFRLFLCHISEFKSTTSVLQKALLPYGISAFVAHKDIEPTNEWQNEIEKALFTMDALAAILMKGFKESNWCDQEVGAAIGRSLLIIALQKGIDPYGFLGKYQGLQTKGKNRLEVAESIFNILVSHDKTTDKMLSSLIGLFLRTNNLSDAEAKLKIISSVQNIPIKHVERLKEKSLENDLINNTEALIKKINKLLKKYDLDEISKLKKLSFDEDDDLPF